MSDSREYSDRNTQGFQGVSSPLSLHYLRAFCCCFHEFAAQRSSLSSAVHSELFFITTVPIRLISSWKLHHSKVGLGFPAETPSKFPLNYIIAFVFCCTYLLS